MCKNTKIWMKAAIMRAIRTIAQTFVATVGTAAVMSEVNWKVVISATVLAGFFIIQHLKGISHFVLYYLYASTILVKKSKSCFFRK